MKWSDYHPILLKYPEVLTLCTLPVRTKTVAESLHLSHSQAYHILNGLRTAGFIAQTKSNNCIPGRSRTVLWQTIKKYDIYIKPVFYWFIRDLERGTLSWEGYSRAQEFRIRKYFKDLGIINKRREIIKTPTLILNPHYERQEIYSALPDYSDPKITCGGTFTDEVRP